MSSSLFKRSCAVAVILLVIGMSIVPSTAIQEFKEVSTVSFNGNTLYVGGSGSNNYTTIQSAIDNATDGDTVFVYDDSSPYTGEIIIEKSINLIGENRNTTIIEIEYGIYIRSDDVIVINFSVIGDGCIGIDGNNVCISNNILDFGTWCITLWTGNSAIITGNIIIGGRGRLYPILIKEGINHLISENSINSEDTVSPDACIHFEGVDDSTISNNSITSTDDGIKISGSNNVIENNKILGCDIGIRIHGNRNIINSNEIRYNYRWIDMEKSRFNKITNNNIIDVESLNNCFRKLSFINTWDGNYWNQPRTPPYIVRGKIVLFIPWFNFDWNPAQEPYDI